VAAKSPELETLSQMRGPADDFTRHEERVLRLIRLQTHWHGRQGLQRLRLWLMQFGRPVPATGAAGSLSASPEAKKYFQAIPENKAKPQD